jgi:phosphoribosyl-ATP pyrophosphohydrolase/phosphoribosyl-AMP cyclohydrolase
MTNPFVQTLDWQKQDGLLPAVVQHADSLQVLMLGYMNAEALQMTLDSGRVTFFSRSKNRLWTKGESSGHFLELVSVETDCDQDTLLVQARPMGNTCHLDRPSCFPDAPEHFLHALENRIAARLAADPASSYTRRMLDKGLNKVAQKVGEEAVETVIAALAEDEAALLNESADLLYHLLLLLRAKGVDLHQVIDVLKSR